MLVLVIMLSLPFFQPGMYNDELSSSAQYGLNVLYRRWRDDMELYEPYANATASAAYYASKGREVYVDDFFLYSYFHSPFTQEDLRPTSAVSSPLSSFNSLFFAGVHPSLATNAIGVHAAQGQRDAWAVLPPFLRGSRLEISSC